MLYTYSKIQNYGVRSLYRDIGSRYTKKGHYNKKFERAKNKLNNIRLIFYVLHIFNGYDKNSKSPKKKKMKSRVQTELSNIWFVRKQLFSQRASIRVLFHD